MEPIQNRHGDEIEIDLVEVFGVLWAHIKMIIISALLVAAIFVTWTKFMITPQYESTARLYVLGKSTSITSLADIQVGASLTNDYAQVITSRTVLEQVIKNLNLGMSYKELAGKITVENPSDTRILSITVRDPEIKEAKEIADETAAVSAEFIGNKMDQDPPTLIQKGYTDSDPVNIKTGRNAAVGGMIGFLAAAAVALLGFFMNDTIQTPDEAEKKIGLNVLGTLPMDEEIHQEKPESRSGRRGRQKITVDPGASTVPGADKVTRLYNGRNVPSGIERSKR